MFWIESCTQQLNDLSEKRASKIPIQQPLHMAASKAGKRSLAWFESITIKVCTWVRCQWKTMFESQIHTCIDWTCSDFLFNFFFEQSTSAFENNHLLCYSGWCAIDQPSISWSRTGKICHNFQVLSYHSGFEIDEVLDLHWAKLVRRETISSPIYVKCYNIHWKKDIKVYLVWPLNSTCAIWKWKICT